MAGKGFAHGEREYKLLPEDDAHKERNAEEADEAATAHKLHDSGAEPLDGTLCPSFPFPLLALRYPGQAEKGYRSSRKVFDPPAGQPRFGDRILNSFMRQFLIKGGDPVRTGFFFDEDSGAVFGEETTVEQLANQVHSTLALTLGGDSVEGGDGLVEHVSSNRSSKRTDAAGALRSASDLGRILVQKSSWPILTEAAAWRPTEDSSYAHLLSQHTFIQKLSLSILLVVLSSMDLMTSTQLIISLCMDERFSGLRTSSEGKFLVYAIVSLMPLYVVLWVVTAYLRANAQVRSDIDYVGDLVWPTGAPLDDTCQERPEGDRLASNRSVRWALAYLHAFTLPYVVRDAVQLCHPRKGAMKFGAFSHRGKMPRVFALGYVNKVMFHFEETAGILSTLPNIVCVKLPLTVVKVYILVSLKFEILLLVSILLTCIINGVKVGSMVQHIKAARHYKRWLVSSLQKDDTASAKTVREKILRKHFFFTESVSEPGHLQDPGIMGWFRMLFGESSSEEEYGRKPMGYLDRWSRTEGLPPDRNGKKLVKSKTVLALRPGEDIGSRIVFSSGNPRIRPEVVDSLQLVHPVTGKVVNEFWYTSDGQLCYDMPQHQSHCCKDTETDEDSDIEWMYARLVTVSSYSVELAWSLFRACWTAFYNISMFNLLVQIVTSKELKSNLDQWFLGLFLVSRLMWFYFSFRRAQRFIILDWCHKADFVVNVGMAGRITLMLSTVIVETFLIPRMIKDTVSLLHPDKRCHPFVAFGGKLYGPRAYAVGFATKDMYTTESLHGIVSQLPVLLADLALTASLCWTLRAKIGLFAFYRIHDGKINLDHQRWLWCRMMTWLVIISSIIHFVNKARIFFRYWTARQNFRPWLKQKLQQSSLPNEVRQALKKEWRAYFGSLDQVLVSGPLSP